jgi:hypothetical protein
MSSAMKVDPSKWVYKTTELWQTAGKWLPTGVSRHPEGPQAFECKMDNTEAEN